MTFESLRNASRLLIQLPHQLPDDVVDGEDREVALKPSSRMRSPRALTSLGAPRSPTRQASSISSSLSERSVV